MKPLALAMVVIHLLTACSAFAQEDEGTTPVSRPNVYGVVIAGTATLLSGAITLLFHGAGNNAYDKYQNATTYADAQEYRNDTEKFDMWRNIGIGTTALALVVTGYTFVRYRNDTERYKQLRAGAEADLGLPLKTEIMSGRMPAYPRSAITPDAPGPLWTQDTDSDSVVLDNWIAPCQPQEEFHYVPLRSRYAPRSRFDAHIPRPGSHR